MKTRLQKILSQAGLLSRRAAEKAILMGDVRVNGQIVTELGSSADPAQDIIEFQGQVVAIKPVHKTLMLHKPIECITTKSDPEGRKTVMDLLPPEHQHLNPIGRLDFYSEGLLLLTNDGELHYRLSHPRFEVEKVYEVSLKYPLSPQDWKRLHEGKLKTGRFDDVEILRQRPYTLRIVLHEGKNRFIRRMFEELESTITILKRVQYGPLKLNLEAGQWREITTQELQSLKNLPELC